MRHPSKEVTSPVTNLVVRLNVTGRDVSDMSILPSISARIFKGHQVLGAELCWAENTISPVWELRLDA